MMVIQMMHQSCFITYKCNDNNDDGICDFCPGGSEPGSPCDDGDSGTYNDTIDDNCDCIGISL